MRCRMYHRTCSSDCIRYKTRYLLNLLYLILIHVHWFYGIVCLVDYIFYAISVLYNSVH